MIKGERLLRSLFAQAKKFLDFRKKEMPVSSPTLLLLRLHCVKLEGEGRNIAVVVKSGL
jgi:hypothetical protein